MNIGKIVATMTQVGADLPAYRALLDQVIVAFSSDEQEALKGSYASALQAADKAHAAAQSL